MPCIVPDPHSFDNFMRESSQKRLRLDLVEITVVVQIFGWRTESDRPQLKVKHGTGRSAATDENGLKAIVLKILTGVYQGNF